jgi:hypothetical protein
VAGGRDAVPIIKGCDGVNAMLSRNSLRATGQKWEIACAKDERREEDSMDAEGHTAVHRQPVNE